jgi:hypothetical protein
MRRLVARGIGILTSYLDAAAVFIASRIVAIPVAVRSKAWVCGRSITRIVDSNSTGGMDVCLL